jgi:diacylglycerol kinase (ATP)
MIRLAVLSNAHSRQNRLGLAPVDAVARAAGVPHIVTQDAAALIPALRQLAELDTELIVVNGGDGTVHATLSALRNGKVFEHEPKLALLRGGTTNMIHRDLGMRQAPHRALSRLVAQARRGNLGRTVTRPVIALRHPAKLEHAYGFFFGAAAIPRAVQAARHRFHKRGMTGPWGESLATTWLVSRLLIRDSATDPVLYPEKLAYVADGGVWHEAPTILFMVTTLDRLLCGVRPVPAHDSLNLLTLTWPHRKLWRALPKLLAGVPETSSNGISQTQARQIAVQASGDFFLDGEIVGTPGSSPICLSADKPAQFVRV